MIGLTILNKHTTLTDFLKETKQLHLKSIQVRHHYNGERYNISKEMKKKSKK